MSSTDLNLKKMGSLPKPGPVGRIVRFGFAVMLLNYAYALYSVNTSFVLPNGQIRSLLWNGLIPGVFLVSYIINIGYSRDWNKKPAIFSAVVMILAAGFNYFMLGSIEGVYVAYTVAIWEFYLSIHLGLAFLIASLIATPGCEMRAFHHLYSILSGNPTQEHICPVGPLNGIDRWEARNSKT